MNIDKAAGIDNLWGKFLKNRANILAKPISELCNLSIKHSLFPTDCHVAKLKPLFKKDSTTLPKNDYSISSLPLISKIIENVIHDQTQVFLDENKILNRFQSRFGKKCSADSCLSYLINKITTGFEACLHTVMVLIDLQKAYEIEIQLNKNFSLICDWFVDNRLRIHFGEGKTKSILFGSQNKIKEASPLNIQLKGKKVKQYSN